MQYVNKTIILTGMMGSGKTTIGRNLACKLNRTFIDSDHEISLASGLTIKEIFEKFGENYFRVGERKIINNILNKKKNTILSVGGGAFINDQSREVINKMGLSVWLKASYETLHKRLKKNIDNRPIFGDQDFETKLKELISSREISYKKAHISVNVDNISISEIVKNIIKELEKKS